MKDIFAIYGLISMGQLVENRAMEMCRCQRNPLCISFPENVHALLKIEFIMAGTRIYRQFVTVGVEILFFTQKLHLKM